eukprot:GILI01015333.1.p1 GENE.GILI01015333.1~~GILI01015333.1.p1  ORF type:complete len:213 (-),score=35.98 GILI01015333.1:48-686(-)
MATRFFKRGATAAAAAARPPVPPVNNAPAKPNQAKSADGSLSIEERMTTLSFAGWKVAIDVDALVTRASPTSPSIRSDGTSAYFESLLAARPDTYLYCEVRRDEGKRPASQSHYVGDASPEFVGQQELLDVLRPYAASGLKREQVLFCATPKGHESFSRQLQPTILITTRPQVASLLAKHVPYIVLVGVGQDAQVAKFPNVLVVDSLAKFRS